MAQGGGAQPELGRASSGMNAFCQGKIEYAMTLSKIQAAAFQRVATRSAAIGLFDNFLYDECI